MELGSCIAQAQSNGQQAVMEGLEEAWCAALRALVRQTDTLLGAHGMSCPGVPGRKSAETALRLRGPAHSAAKLGVLLDFLMDGFQC